MAAHTGRDQAGGGGAHDAAAALGVVRGGVAEVEGALEGGEAGVAGGAAGVEPALADQPAVGAAVARRLHRPRGALPGDALGVEPAQVGVVDAARGVADASRLATDPGADQALGGEERHLGVVGDGADPAVGLLELRDAFSAVLSADLGEGEELDGGAEGVPGEHDGGAR